jgi:DNA-binding PadR family transcriptional regulator
MPESFERGALTEAVFYILLSLHQPMHGYAIMQNIEKLTAGRVALGPGTLYGALNALAQKGWIAAHSEGSSANKKEYAITPAGKYTFAGELARLRELLQNGERIEKGAQS